MTPMQLAHEAESAYDSRDRERLRMTVGRLAAMATPPDLSRLTREQLQQRRGVFRLDRDALCWRELVLDGCCFTHVLLHICAGLVGTYCEPLTHTINAPQSFRAM